jgi:KUP system potassium uptake protein
VTHDPGSAAPPDRRRLAGLTLLALGIVYGDIGTSPLYALRECFGGAHPVSPTNANVLGILSLIFWVLILVVTVKYQLYVLRADNRGEGGILVLMALVRPEVQGALRKVLVAIGLFGAALLYGDGIITPAISVLSAVEGLEVTTAVLHLFVVPITIGILVGLFLFQSRGSGGIGKVFGPVMVLWFATLAVLGVLGILRQPSVLWAVNPLHAVRFFAENRVHGFLILGTVFLVATGGEALYADMGHFGHTPIRIGWFTMVAPALVLNYFGQGALLVRDPGAAKNPFYLLAPSWALYPLVALSALATVIASQAIISGAFSLTRQAVQLGYLPRVKIVHTSWSEIGQIYIPSVNWLLMAATIGLVLAFRSSSHLAAAYGVAVTTTMMITTVLAFVVARRRWKWPLWAALGVTVPFLAVDLAFFGANMVKVLQGGWFPLAAGAFVYLLMTTWKKGRDILAGRLQTESYPFAQFVARLRPESLARVPGTAVFMSRYVEAMPPALLHNLKHNKVLHRQIVLLNVVTEEIPQVPREERVELIDLGKGFYQAIAHFGFMETPGVPEMLDSLRAKGLDLNPARISFFLGRETLIATKRPGMAIWREKLFSVMARNSLRPTDFFHIPANRVVELGLQVEL